MTSKEHIREAERILVLTEKVAEDNPALPILLAEAQVHATLAVALKGTE